MAAFHSQGPTRAVQAQEVPDVDRVLDHLDDLYRGESSHATMTMTVERERGTRELTLEAWSRGTEEALIVIREPAREAGTATLMNDEGLWNYAPRADRLIRIPSGLLSENWMGSHFTNDDLLRETSYREDYRASAAWGELEGARHLEITLTPRPDAPVVYTRLVFYLTPETWTPVTAEYFDQGDRVRMMRYEEVREVSGRRIPMRLVLEPVEAPGERTVVEYHELEFDVPLAEGLFTRRGLRRVARS